MLSVENDDQGTLLLVGEASMREAEALREALAVAYAEKRDDWTLDLSRLESLDTCTAQLLLSFKRSVAALRVHSCGKKVRDFLEQTGLAEHLL